MISYAQNHEDVLLDRAFARGHRGFYIDVGAHDPVVDSVTKHFYDLGWHGINVEPTSHLFERFPVARARDVNLEVGVAGQPGEATFYEFPPALSGISTFSAEEAARHREAGFAYAEKMRPTITLQQLCEEHVHGPIDFLSIDVEGYEREVIEGGDWRTWRPRVVVVEAIEPLTPPARFAHVGTHETWEPLLLVADYSFAAFDGLNRFYVRAEDADLADALKVPVNVTDDFIDYQVSSRIHELSMLYEGAAGQLTAARLLNHNVLLEYHGFAEELKLLRAEYEKLERELTNSQVQSADVRRLAAEAEQMVEKVRFDLAAASARWESLDALLGGIGPATFAVARRLGRVARRYPKASSAVRSGLLKGLRLKRTLATQGPTPPRP